MPEQQISDFMAAYAEGFTTRTPAETCRFWLFPATISAGESVTCFDDEAAFARNVAALGDFYRRQGVTRAEKSVTDCRLVLPGCAFVTTDDRMYDATGALVNRWRHHYALRKVGADWRIAFAVADEEIAAWHDRGTPLG
jgi:hypothetical protein